MLLLFSLFVVQCTKQKAGNKQPAADSEQQNPVEKSAEKIPQDKNPDEKTLDEDKDDGLIPVEKSERTLTGKVWKSCHENATILEFDDGSILTPTRALGHRLEFGENGQGADHEISFSDVDCSRELKQDDIDLFLVQFEALCMKSLPVALCKSNGKGISQQQALHLEAAVRDFSYQATVDDKGGTLDFTYTTGGVFYTSYQWNQSSLLIADGYIDGLNRVLGDRPAARPADFNRASTYKP